MRPGQWDLIGSMLANNVKGYVVFELAKHNLFESNQQNLNHNKVVTILRYPKLNPDTLLRPFNH